MQIGTALKEGLQVLVLGLGITLVALSLLIVVINVINKLINRDKSSEATGTNKTDNSVDKTFSMPIEDNNNDLKDGELVAAISAAIAMMLDDGDQPFKIKKITQISASTPKWNQASRAEQMLNRR